ncbi:xyloglucan 6-xylosyltransferase 2-like [Andrographis paniculata]|uniref:xyloglucan 6-xylosyltransferase 2-like n=1 Tax=Andrographis paniculata TaxID=175694 RepID=UPI0021E777D9|nr:xyloglucan 6-xylosyltransferase 2-like [Andrographis paniculata]
MFDKVISPCRSRRLHRYFRNGKLTLLCLILTVIMFRAYLGAGRFGTPEKDLNEIRQTFAYLRRRAEPRRILESVSTASQFHSRVYRYADFDAARIFNDGDGGGVGELKRNESEPYRLGARISDWDNERLRWLRRNPKFPNFVGRRKPRVLLVTGSSPKPCENPVGDHYLLKSLKNKVDYCRLHGLEMFYNMALLDAEMSGFWAKLPLIRKLLVSHPEVELLWWMDSDAMFTDMAFELPWERYKNHNLILHGWDHKVYGEKHWVGLNTGSFLLRNCQWSLDLLDVWAPMGPVGKAREEAGEVLTRELKDRPVFEADDQSAMVYILATQREKWKDKVYLENAFYLHGYWGILVDRYEEMIDSYHPGLGDQRWPLVTHFVGCKPCGEFGDYSVERCLKQMNRAYNFGDNQILQMYGFGHKTLASRRVVRIRNDSGKPLEVEDEFGLLHPPFKSVKLNSY